MIDLHLLEGKVRTLLPKPTIIFVLVPLFLIISSSVYPAIISSIQSNEQYAIGEAAAKLSEDGQTRSTYTINHHVNRAILSGSNTDFISPTPTDPLSSPLPPQSPSLASTPLLKATSKLSDTDDKMAATAINPDNPVHVVWDDDTSGNFDIFYKRDGADFDPTTINLSNNIGLGVGAQIATQGNTLYVVWQDNELGDNEIFFKRSTDGGATFGPTINLSDNVGESMLPSVAVSGNNVHVVWMDDSDSGINDIFYRRSTDGGANFVEPAKNISDNVGDSDSPAIAVSASTVHVVWQDNTPGNNDILYRRSTNNGSCFSSNKEPK